MIIYYTEYPKGEFRANSDKEALEKSKAKLIYKETEDGKSFIILRENTEINLKAT